MPPAPLSAGRADLPAGVLAALDDPPDSELGVVEAAGIPFATRAWGDPSAPPLLLIHGVTSSSRIWWRLGPALAAGLGRRVVAIDQAGHGRTGHWTGHHRFRDNAADVAAFIAAAGLDRPELRVVGHSWGAMTAAELPAVGVRPEVLVLLDPPAIPLAAIATMLDDPIERHYDDVDEAIAALGRLNPTWAYGDVAAKSEALTQFDEPAVRAILTENGDWDGGLAALADPAAADIPIWLVRGEPASGGLIPDEAAAGFVARLGADHVITIGGGAHSPMRQVPEATTLALLRSTGNEVAGEACPCRSPGPIPSRSPGASAGGSPPRWAKPPITSRARRLRSGRPSGRPPAGSRSGPAPGSVEFAGSEPTPLPFLFDVHPDARAPVAPRARDPDDRRRRHQGDRGRRRPAARRRLPPAQALPVAQLDGSLAAARAGVRIARDPAADRRPASRRRLLGPRRPQPGRDGQVQRPGVDRRRRHRPRRSGRATERGSGRVLRVARRGQPPAARRGQPRARRRRTRSPDRARRDDRPAHDRVAGRTRLRQPGRPADPVPRRVRRAGTGSAARRQPRGARPARRGHRLRRPRAGVAGVPRRCVRHPARLRPGQSRSRRRVARTAAAGPGVAGGRDGSSGWPGSRSWDSSGQASTVRTTAAGRGWPGARRSGSRAA